MDCSEVHEKLSPFYDGELPAPEHAAVASHLAECSRCADEVAAFEQCSEALGQLPQPAGAPSWAAVSAKLSAKPTSHPPSPRRFEKAVPVASRQPIPFAAGLLTMAASVLLLVGLGLWRSEPLAPIPPAPIPPNSPHHTADFAATMDHYLKTLDENPAQAERYLMERYHGQSVDAEQAVRLVGYRPAIAEGLPDGYSPASTSVLKMPCCTCVKVVCRRRDGSSLVLFEHQETSAEWLGDRPSRMAACGDEECCLVDLDRSIAATWQIGSHSITAVGARDLNEVDHLVDWLKTKHSSLPRQL